MTTITQASIVEIEATMPGDHERDVAQEVLRNATMAQIRAFALAQLADTIRELRRGRSRRVEEGAVKPSRRKGALSGDVQQILERNQAEAQERVAAERERWRTADAEAHRLAEHFKATGSWGVTALQLEQKSVGDEDPLRMAIRRFNEPGQDAFLDEVDRLGVVLEPHQVIGWLGFSGLMRQGVRREINEAARLIRLEVSEQLLTSEFALGDGRTVTWGEATLDDHRTRVRIGTNNAVANMEDAARHTAAINMLLESGSSRLVELAPVRLAA